jgi:hypothetical protein
MKKLTLALAALSVSFAFAFTPAAKSAQTGDPIQTIRQHYTQINSNVRLYTKVKKELAGFSAEGGQLMAYSHGPTIMKMVATFYGEGGRSTEEYYYWDGKLIFVFRTESRYDKPLSGKVVKKIENRFYFNDDKLIRWIDENSKQVASDTNEYKEKQNEYLKSSKQLADGARSAKPSIEATP